MKHWLDLSAAEQTQWLASRDQPRYRRDQIERWLFQGRAASWQDMTDLPRGLRDLLAEEFVTFAATIDRHTTCDDGTEKLLLELGDGGQIECVLLRDEVRRTICISTQVGCAMGCVFCASGLDGVMRNLTTGEIIEQMLQLQRLLSADERLSHIVVMGMGEPLANLDNLLPALDRVKAAEAFDISGRRITISTVGLPAGLMRLAETAPRYRLAVSLHAPTDVLRDELVPVNRKLGGLDAIFAAADAYFEVSGRRLTFEYVLLAGINDQPQHARQLARRLASRNALLNVIPYNPVDGLPYATPTAAAQQTFRKILDQAGIAVRFRHRKGDKIDAACGQLRRHAATRT